MEVQQSLYHLLETQNVSYFTAAIFDLYMDSVVVAGASLNPPRFELLKNIWL